MSVGRLSAHVQSAIDSRAGFEGFLEFVIASVHQVTIYRQSTLTRQRDEARAYIAWNRAVQCGRPNVQPAELESGMPTSAASPAHQSFSTADLNARATHRRAIDAIIWGIPAVNFDLMYQSFQRDAKGGVNQIAYWSRIPNWKNQTLTPNPDTLYFMPFFSTKDVGPLVLEIPPADEGSITGTIMNCWQEALEDVGPAGMDKGKGGKYLITPPGFTGQCLTATSICRRTTIRDTRSCARFSRAAATPTSPRR